MAKYKFSFLTDCGQGVTITIDQDFTQFEETEMYDEVKHTFYHKGIIPYLLQVVRRHL